MSRETADLLHASTGGATLENAMVLLGIDIEGFVVSDLWFVVDLRSALPGILQAQVAKYTKVGIRGQV